MSCELPARPADAPLPASAALILAEQAIRAAVPAAAQHAAAVRASAIVHHEAKLTAAGCGRSSTGGSPRYVRP